MSGRLIEKLELDPGPNPGFLTLAKVATALELDLNALAGIQVNGRQHPLTRPSILLDPRETPAAASKGTTILLIGRIRTLTRRGEKAWIELEDAAAQVKGA